MNSWVKCVLVLFLVSVLDANFGHSHGLTGKALIRHFAKLRGSHIHRMVYHPQGGIHQMAREYGITIESADDLARFLTEPSLSDAFIEQLAYRAMGAQRMAAADRAVLGNVSDDVVERAFLSVDGLGGASPSFRAVDFRQIRTQQLEGIRAVTDAPVPDWRVAASPTGVGVRKGGEFVRLNVQEPYRMFNHCEGGGWGDAFEGLNGVFGLRFARSRLHENVVYEANPSRNGIDFWNAQTGDVIAARRLVLDKVDERVVQFVQNADGSEVFALVYVADSWNDAVVRLVKWRPDGTGEIAPAAQIQPKLQKGLVGMAVSQDGKTLAMRYSTESGGIKTVLRNTDDLKVKKAKDDDGVWGNTDDAWGDSNWGSNDGWASESPGWGPSVGEGSWGKGAAASEAKSWGSTNSAWESSGWN